MRITYSCIKLPIFYRLKGSAKTLFDHRRHQSRLPDILLILIEPNLEVNVADCRRAPVLHSNMIHTKGIHIASRSERGCGARIVYTLWLLVAKQVVSVSEQDAIKLFIAMARIRQCPTGSTASLQILCNTSYKSTRCVCTKAQALSLIHI